MNAEILLEAILDPQIAVVFDRIQALPVITETPAREDMTEAVARIRLVVTVALGATGMMLGIAVIGSVLDQSRAGGALVERDLMAETGFHNVCLTGLTEVLESVGSVVEQATFIANVERVG